jgi:hypothetical protein
MNTPIHDELLWESYTTDRRRKPWPLLVWGGLVVAAFVLGTVWAFSGAGTVR